MDLLAALTLVMVIEGLALAVLARSLPEIMAEIDRLQPDTTRKLGLGLVIVGGALYLVIRQGGVFG